MPLTMPQETALLKKLLPLAHTLSVYNKGFYTDGPDPKNGGLMFTVRMVNVTTQTLELLKTKGYLVEKINTDAQGNLYFYAKKPNQNKTDAKTKTKTKKGKH